MSLREFLFPRPELPPGIVGEFIRHLRWLVLRGLECPRPVLTQLHAVQAEINTLVQCLEEKTKSEPPHVGCYREGGPR